MTRLQIMDIQDRIGVVADGFWGAKSIAACQRHLRALMPELERWPKQDQKSLTAFYGPPGKEEFLVNIRPPVPVYYAGQRVKTIRCHMAVADSLYIVLDDIAYTTSHVKILQRYDGCYNNRMMRGGSLPSLHARGAAIDFDAAANGNKTSWPVRATMPFGVMEAFAKEGWISAGAFWGRDAMHFQATR